MAIFVGPVMVETHRWSNRDSLRLTVFAAQVALERFESHYPEYRRPRCALNAASFALDRLDPEATRRSRLAGQELARIARRAVGQGAPAEPIQCVRVVASAARSAGWENDGTKARRFVEDALITAAEIDQYLSARARQWLHFYLNATRNIQPTTRPGDGDPYP